MNETVETLQQRVKELEAENKALRSALKTGVYHVKRMRQGYGLDWTGTWVKEASNLKINVNLSEMDRFKG